MQITATEVNSRVFLERCFYFDYSVYFSLFRASSDCVVPWLPLHRFIGTSWEASFLAGCFTIILLSCIKRWNGEEVVAECFRAVSIAGDSFGNIVRWIANTAYTFMLRLVGFAAKQGILNVFEDLRDNSEIQRMSDHCRFFLLRRRNLQCCTVCNYRANSSWELDEKVLKTFRLICQVLK